jgi:hypothetical protein
VGEHLSKHARCRMKPLIFECMDRISHAALVDAVCNRTGEGRRSQPAGTA